MTDTDDYPGENIDREILEAEREIEAENTKLREQRDALREGITATLAKWEELHPLVYWGDVHCKYLELRETLKAVLESIKEVTMDQLTQEGAERCARACGWLYCSTSTCDEPIVPYWHVPKEEGQHVHAKELSLSPRFWFPRLWEKLKEKCGAMESVEILYCPKYGTGVSVGRYTEPYKPGTIEQRRDFPGDEVLALCMAIETL